MVEYVSRDRVLHRRLLELVGNANLTEIVLRLRAQSRLLGLSSLAHRGGLAASAREHHALIEALAGSDAERVETLMREHLAHVRNEWAGR